MPATPSITEMFLYHLGEPRAALALPSDLPEPYRLELMHTYEEPRFTEFMDEVFGETGFIRWDRLGFEEDQTAKQFRRDQMRGRPTLRIAARHHEELIGYSFAFADYPNALYMGSSAVDAAHRRKGVYRAMARTVVDLAREMGFHQVHSRHVCTNNPILIAKLGMGFRVTGLELSPDMGSLLRLEFPLNPVREHAIMARSGLVRMSPELAALLSEG